MSVFTTTYEYYRLKLPYFARINALGGRCIKDDGSQRILKHQIANYDVARALQPIVTYPFSQLYIPDCDYFSTISVCNNTIDLPIVLATKIACMLGNADELDTLAATSKAWRAVARCPASLESLIKPWFLPNLVGYSRLQEQPNTYCPRSLSRTFQRIHLVVQTLLDGWDVVLWQSAALGCVHGTVLALNHGARVNEYSGGRQNGEGPALWCAAKFNFLTIVKILCEDGHAYLEQRGGLKTNSSPLWVAAREGNSAIMRYLLTQGADRTSQANDGRGSSVLQIGLRAVREYYGSALDMFVLLEWIRDGHPPSVEWD